MSRSVLLAEALIPDTGKSVLLYQHKDKFSIVIPGRGELMNSRVHGSEKALAELLCAEPAGFNAILLDVDNGPKAVIRRENDWLYGLEGLTSARRALRPGGVLAVWSAGPDVQFNARLGRAGFKSELVIVRPHRAGKGARHYIWLAWEPA